MKKLTFKVLLVAVLSLLFVGTVIASTHDINNSVILNLGGNLGGVQDDPEPEVVYCDSINNEELILQLGGNLGGVQDDPEPEVVYCDSVNFEDSMLLLGGNLGGVQDDPEPEVVYCEIEINSFSQLYI